MTNIPSTNPIFPVISGSENCYLDIDYLVIDQDFSTSR